jgi:hypothetical protein
MESSTSPPVVGVLAGVVAFADSGVLAGSSGFCGAGLAGAGVTVDCVGVAFEVSAFAEAEFAGRGGYFDAEGAWGKDCCEVSCATRPRGRIAARTKIITIFIRNFIIAVAEQAFQRTFRSVLLWPRLIAKRLAARL